MRRSASITLGLATVGALLASCSDAGIAPAGPSAAPSRTLDVPRVAFDQMVAGSSVEFTVTIDPRVDNVYSDGLTTIRIPAGSVCDPATSSYGPGTWDAPCAPATASFSVPVTLTVLKSNRALLHFGKDLRFVPTADAAKQVRMSVSLPELKTTNESARRFAIFWVPNGSSQLVDEGRSDKSLVTTVDRENGRLFRRLKHFSGYVIRIGTSDVTGQCDNPDASTDDNCVPEGEVTTN